MTGISLQTLQISSSWIGGHGDIIEAGTKLANGKKLKPRKRRGKKLSEAVRLETQQKAERARERRRGGFELR